MNIAQGIKQINNGQILTNRMEDFVKKLFLARKIVDSQSVNQPAAPSGSSTFAQTSKEDEEAISKLSLSSSPDAKDYRAKLRQQLVDPNDRVMWDSTVLAKMQGTLLKIEGSGNLVTGVVDTTVTSVSFQIPVSA